MGSSVSTVKQPPSPKPTALYQPLGRDEIRLLTILPSADPSRQISCELQTVSLSPKPHYRALSYVWGDPIPTATIEINGLQRDVTPNLGSALYHIRDQSRPQTFWIDAVCINQSDVAERNEQVMLMGEIYSSAVEVLAWLGPEADGSGEAMALLARWGQELSRLGIHDTATFKRRVREPDVIKSLTLNTSGVGYRGFKPLAALHRRAWWSRLWVLQEILLARKVIFQCGKDQAEFHWLLPHLLFRGVLGPTITHMQDDDTDWFKRTTSDIRELPMYRAWSEGFVRRGEKPDFGDLLIMVSASVHRQATDPRDKVFGLLGLVEKSKWEITANYEESIETAYLNFARIVMEKKFRSLNILSFAGIGYPKPDNKLDLPTWVPDWRAEAAASFPNPFPVLRYSAAEGRYEGKPRLSTSNILTADGIPIGKVLDVLPPSDKWGSANWAKNSAWKPFLFDNPKVKLQYGPEIPPLQAFFRTICADMDPLSSGLETRMLQYDSDHFFNLVATFLYLWCALTNTESDVSLKIIELRDVPPSLGLGTFFDPDRTEGSLQWPNNKNFLEALDRAALVQSYPAIINRCLFITDRGQIGLGPPLTREGDLVAVLFGSEVPLILRTESSSCELVGGCFVLGCMTGEVVKDFNRGVLHQQAFEIH